jgi:hypothetical protein
VRSYKVLKAHSNRKAGDIVIFDDNIKKVAWTEWTDGFNFTHRSISLKDMEYFMPMEMTRKEFIEALGVKLPDFEITVDIGVEFYEQDLLAITAFRNDLSTVFAVHCDSLTPETLTKSVDEVNKAWQAH